MPAKLAGEVEVSVGDTYAFILKGNVAQQLTVNVFHYKAFTSGDVDLDALVLEFDTTVVNALLTCMTDSAGFVSTEIKQVVGGFAYLINEYVSIIGGAVSGETLPPSDCWTFRYVRTQLGRRHGYKRIAGVPESFQASGLATIGALTTLRNVATVLEADLVPSSGISLRPVILHEMLNGQPVVPPVPQDIGAVVYSHIGTQNSRKYGHGR